MRLEVSGLCKSFAVPVLKDVNFELMRGSVHGLVGENGAGKSTLINILTGLLVADEGRICIEGSRFKPSCVKDALDAGVSVAAQELSLIENLSVGENILLKALPSAWFGLNGNKITTQSRDLLELVGLGQLDPNKRVSELSLAEKQLVELAKALSSDSRILILDEPTSALTGPQADTLHQILRERAEKGLSVIYISHRLSDVLRVCDTVSVLRDGEIQMTSSTENLVVEDLIKSMSGQVLLSHNNDQSRQTDVPRLVVSSLVSTDLPDPITFTCHKGEILGVAGLAGSGRSELLEAIYGLTRRRGGEVALCSDGKQVSINCVQDAVKNRMGFMAEDRKTKGIFTGKSVSLNTTITGLGRVSNAWGYLFSGRERQFVTQLIEQFKVKCEGPLQSINHLSGGNQQKLLLARWTHSESDVWLLDEPTRGVDVGSKLAIHEHLRSMRDKGAAMVIVSSEIEELTALCDRILVLSNRQHVATFERGAWTHEAILSAAFSQYSDSKNGYLRRIEQSTKTQ